MGEFGASAVFVIACLVLCACSGSSGGTAATNPTPSTAPRLTEYTIPTANSFPIAITTGPDGALWFTEANKIGRVTTSGVFTEYTIPTANSLPYGIISGSDGALWFTENDANK